MKFKIEIEVDYDSIGHYNVPSFEAALEKSILRNVYGGLLLDKEQNIVMKEYDVDVNRMNNKIKFY